MRDSRLSQISALVDDARNLVAEMGDELGACQARLHLQDLRDCLNSSIAITNYLKATDDVV